MGIASSIDQSSATVTKTQIGWPFLCFGSRTNPIDDRKSYGVPFLPSYYSYLIKISSSVGVVEIYPWLAELMFHSSAVDYDDLVEIAKQNETPTLPTMNDGKTIPRYALNVVSLTIDESMDAIADVAVPRVTDYAYERGAPERSDQTANYVRHAITRDLYNNLRNLSPNTDKSRGSSRTSSPMPRLFQIDTMATFGDISQERPSWIVDPAFKVPLYCRSSVVGSGNPMRLLQRFVAMGATINDRENRLSLHGIQQLAPTSIDGEKIGESLGLLNCFIINSIGNLSRRLGFRDTMHLIRAMMERGVWQLGEGSGTAERTTGSNGPTARSLFERPGLMFALVTEDVFTKEELRYAETFFDGVIRFDEMGNTGGRAEGSRRRSRTICYEFERFPLLESELRLDRSMPENRPYGPTYLFNVFAPDYANRYHYLPLAGARLDPIREEPETANKL